MPNKIELPAVHSLGVLKRLDFDIADQSIIVTLGHSLVQDVKGSAEVRGVFEGVCYLRLISDLPISFAEDDMDLFEERPASDLLDEIILKKDGWTYLVSDLDNAVIGTPAKSPPSLRHFLLKSSTVSGEWLCASAWFTVERDTTHQ